MRSDPERTYNVSFRVPTVFLYVVALIYLMYGQAAASTLNVTYASSISTTGGDPLRIAMYAGAANVSWGGSSGTLYVATPEAGKVLKFSQDGKPLGFIGGFKKPLSVAVDNSGKVYIGDVKDGSVSVMNAGGQFLFKLGKGKGEFVMPGDIAIASNGSVYVSDSPNNVVKVYDSRGAYQKSFGGYGTGGGQMIFPTGVSVDNAAQEVYVSDHNNGRVEVFDMGGTYKRSISSFGGSQGQLTRPHGIYAANGKVYVADAYQSCVDVFDSSGNFITTIGQYGTDPGKLRIPMDVTMSGTKLFVSDSDNGRIEVFDVVDPQALTITPGVLSFKAYVGANPPAQSVQVNAAVSGSAVAWTATASAPFTVALDKASGTTPSTVMVSIDVTGLVAGSYSGVVNFTAASGINYPLAVNLTVSRPLPQFSVSPTSIDLVYQKDGTLSLKTLSAVSSEMSLQWTAAGSGGQWLDVSPPSGVTPGTINVALNQKVSGLNEGTYKTSVSVNAPGFLSGPIGVPVTLRVVAAGTLAVSTNLDSASFTIAGPSNYTGSGKFWSTGEAKAGTYTIRFGFVKGYRRPATRTFQVLTGKSALIDVKYEPLDVANVIVAAKGPGAGNNAVVRVIDKNGTVISEFRAFATATGGDTWYGAVVAAADLDGDGTSEILAAPGPGADNQAAINVFRYDGTLLSSAGPFDSTWYGANIAVGDILGDGRHEVAMSMVTVAGVHTVVIFESNGYNLVERTKVAITNNSNNPANLAFGDVDGDGRLELIVSTQDGISIYAFDDTLTPTLVSGSTGFNGTVTTPSGATVSAGDVDGDGVDEILFGYVNGADSFVGFYDGSLKPHGSAVKAFAGGQSAPTLSSMDWSGDGTAEVLAGKGASASNDAVLRIYKSDGTLIQEIKAFDASQNGVNAAFGMKK